MSKKDRTPWIKHVLAGIFFILMGVIVFTGLAIMFGVDIDWDRWTVATLMISIGAGTWLGQMDYETEAK